MHNIIALHKRIMRALWCLAKIAEQGGEGIIALDLDGTIRFVNATWATMHGYDTRHELIGKHISIFHTQSQMENDVTPFIEEAKLRGQLMGPAEHIRKDGSSFSTKMKMIVIRDESGRSIGLIGFITDITEHEQAEIQLKQQSAGLTTANEKLQQINPGEQTEIKWKEQHNKLEQCIEEETIELITANETLQQQINQLEQAEVRWREQHSQLEKQVEEKTNELTATNEKLQHEIAERNQREEQLQQDRNQLKERNTELTATNEKLQQQINQLEQAEVRWREQHSQLEKQVEEKTNELTATNEKLQHEIAERNQREEQLQQDRNQLKERNTELTATNEKLQQQINHLKLPEEAPSGYIFDAEETKMRTKLPFNPQELEVLSKLAKRLM